MNRNMMRTLQRMGISVEPVTGVKEVHLIFDDKILKLINPSVVITKASGQNIYQIVAEKIVEEKPSTQPSQPTTEPQVITIPEEDIILVAEQAGVSKDKAKQALLQTNGDIAAAILMLKTKR